MILSISGGPCVGMVRVGAGSLVARKKRSCLRDDLLEWLGAKEEEIGVGVALSLGSAAPRRAALAVGNPRGRVILTTVGAPAPYREEDGWTSTSLSLTTWRFRVV
jgi:hypothetical protein